MCIIEGRARATGSLSCVDPTLNIHPETAPTFLKPSDRAMNRNAFATWAMPDNAWGGGWGTWCGRF
jgi:hypothetical protein